MSGKQESPGINRKGGAIERSGAVIQRAQATIKRAGTAISRKALDIRTLFEPQTVEPAPIGEDADLLDVLDAEVDAVVESVRQGRKEYAEFVKALDDTKFYCTLVFQSEGQKNEFIRRANLEDVSDDHNYDNMFLNGVEVARRLGVEVQPVELLDYKLRGDPSKYKKEVIGNE